MRLRHVKGAKDLIASQKKYIHDNVDNTPINIHDFFNNDKPVHIEIGMGKGQFIHTLSKRNKEINYIGIERFDSVIVRALEKQVEDPQDNLLLLRTDAKDLITIFNQEKVDRIYLNFSDPWPKDRHAKRRLTHKNFLDIYKELLTTDGELHFKTDNLPLFEYSLESLEEYGMNIMYKSFDLHNSDFKGNIMTEFEERFSKLGNKINKLTATFKE
jgi:tRNA (guanine-N7-)-methyltransferase